jgi:hypothetical protein
MANNLSNFAENELLDHILGVGSYTMPTVYVALYTTDPTDADTGTEVSGGAYARQTVTFSASSGGATSNPTKVTFPAATASWGTITHIGLRDAATAGNLLWHGALSTSKAVATDDTFEIGATKLSVSLG